jgi:hypothetical protein
MTKQINGKWDGPRWEKHVSVAQHVFGVNNILFYELLPALTYEGVIALDIFKGSVNKEHFLQFLNEQLVCNVFCYILIFYNVLKPYTGSKIEPIP